MMEQGSREYRAEFAGTKEFLTESEIAASGERIREVIANIEKVILGKHQMVELTVLALISGGACAD